MNPRYRRVAARAEHRCEYCRAPEIAFNFPFEIEHIIPSVHGGADVEENLALACRACNVRKAAYIEHSDPLTRMTTRLYHPRQDRWSDHFRVDKDTAVIEGVTAIGRASVARMAMNSSAQVEARRLWTRLGIFP